MLYCPKCGKAVPDEATACPTCGTVFEPEPELIFDPPKPEGEKESKKKSKEKSPDVKSAFKAWAHDQGMFCLIAKALAVTVMVFYLLTAIVSAISLIVAGSSGGAVFSTFFLDLLGGIVYGVIIWLLSDAVLYLQKLYEMKKKETKE